MTSCERQSTRDSRENSLHIVLALTVLAAMLLTAPTYAQEGDHGGKLLAYTAQVDRLNREKRAKRISGVCASACSVFLGVRRVCVERDAQVWFHAAYEPASLRPDPTGTLVMLSYYPRRVRRWAIQTRALERTSWSAEHMLTGEQLIQMGLSPCR
jgi:hypothetical protein